MVVGVNGAGKTTSVGKLARHLVDADQKVLLAAADTFRAAAREQLLAWAERAGAAERRPTRPARSRSSARKAAIRRRDLRCGRRRQGARLRRRHRRHRRPPGDAGAPDGRAEEDQARRSPRPRPGAPHEVLLVIDGNTGQNALAQVQAFDEALQLTGLVVTKLDGTAKGGVLAAIALWSRVARATPLPVYFVGVGEKLDDLQTFRAREFARGAARADAAQRFSSGGSSAVTESSSSNHDGRARLAHLDHLALASSRGRCRRTDRRPGRLRRRRRHARHRSSRRR